MAWFHLIFGLVLFVVFTQTGEYMRADFPDKEAISQELRILMRSRHIYILFSALIHLTLGVYFQLRIPIWRRAFQIGGSTILVISSGLLFSAFVVETYTYQQFSDLSRNGIYLALAGIGMHLVGGLSRRSTV